MQLPPHPSLAHLVRHYLVLEGQELGTYRHRLFSDGNTGMVFNFGHAALQVGETGAAQEAPCWLYGQVPAYHELTLSGNSCLIIVVMQPYGAFNLWGVPAPEWNGHFFQASAFRNAVLQRLSEHMPAARTLQQRIALIERSLLQQSGTCTLPDQVIVQAVQLITEAQGNITIADIIRNMAVTERSLERKFNLQVGISPKHFSSIVRLNASAKLLQGTANESLTSIGYTAGYFDQAHFIRTFKKHTGFTPYQYQHAVQPLALNFVQYK